MGQPRALAGMFLRTGSMISTSCKHRLKVVIVAKSTSVDSTVLVKVCASSRPPLLSIFTRLISDLVSPHGLNFYVLHSSDFSTGR